MNCSRCGKKLPYDDLSEQDFRSACLRAGVNPKNFTQNDLDDLQDYLNLF